MITALADAVLEPEFLIALTTRNAEHATNAVALAREASALGAFALRRAIELAALVLDAGLGSAAGGRTEDARDSGETTEGGLARGGASVVDLAERRAPKR